MNVFEECRLRMGVDLPPETDAEHVQHCWTTEVPRYAIEVLAKDVGWEKLMDVDPSELVDCVEKMHTPWGLSPDHKVYRLTENDYPVFAVYN